MKSLAVRVLSDFGVDGIEPQALGSRKARLALHLLAIAGGHSNRARITTRPNHLIRQHEADLGRALHNGVRQVARLRFDKTLRQRWLHPQ